MPTAKVPKVPRYKKCFVIDKDDSSWLKHTANRKDKLCHVMIRLARSRPEYHEAFIDHKVYRSLFGKQNTPPRNKSPTGYKRSKKIEKLANLMPDLPGTSHHKDICPLCGKQNTPPRDKSPTGCKKSRRIEKLANPMPDPPETSQMEKPYAYLRPEGMQHVLPLYQKYKCNRRLFRFAQPERQFHGPVKAMEEPYVYLRPQEIQRILPPRQKYKCGRRLTHLARLKRKVHEPVKVQDAYHSPASLKDLSTAALQKLIPGSAIGEEVEWTDIKHTESELNIMNAQRSAKEVDTPKLDLKQHKRFRNTVAFMEQELAKSCARYEERCKNDFKHASEVDSKGSESRAEEPYHPTFGLETRYWKNRCAFMDEVLAKNHAWYIKHCKNDSKHGSGVDSKGPKRPTKKTSPPKSGLKLNSKAHPKRSCKLPAPTSTAAASPRVEEHANPKIREEYQPRDDEGLKNELDCVASEDIGASAKLENTPSGMSASE